MNHFVRYLKPGAVVTTILIVFSLCAAAAFVVSVFNEGRYKSVIINVVFIALLLLSLPILNKLYPSKKGFANMIIRPRSMLVPVVVMGACTVLVFYFLLSETLSYFGKVTTSIAYIFVMLVSVNYIEISQLGERSAHSQDKQS